MEIKSTRQGNSIYDELKERIYINYILEKKSVCEKYTTEDEVYEALITAEDNYISNLFKLDEVASLNKAEDDIKKRFIKQKLYIEKLEINEKEKLESILTSACLLTRFGLRINNLDENSFYLLANIMKDVDLKDYANYEKRLDGILALIRESSNIKQVEKTITKTK